MRCLQCRLHCQVADPVHWSTDIIRKSCSSLNDFQLQLVLLFHISASCSCLHSLLLFNMRIRTTNFPLVLVATISYDTYVAKDDAIFDYPFTFLLIPLTSQHVYIYNLTVQHLLVTRSDCLQVDNATVTLHLNLWTSIRVCFSCSSLCRLEPVLMNWCWPNCLGLFAD